MFYFLSELHKLIINKHLNATQWVGGGGVKLYKHLSNLVEYSMLK